MNTRSSRKLVTFAQPFQLTGMDRVLPAGTYEVTTEEEQIGDFVYEAYRRISTSIYLPPQPSDCGIGQIIVIDPDELADTLKKTPAAEGNNVVIPLDRFATLKAKLDNALNFKDFPPPERPK